MPHLHLPTDHTDADLVLAAHVAELVGSADLYVAWSHDHGAGAVPEVEAVVREERPKPVAAALISVAAGFAAVWRALFTRPSHEIEPPAAAARPRRAAGEPSA